MKPSKQAPDAVEKKVIPIAGEPRVRRLGRTWQLLILMLCAFQSVQSQDITDPIELSLKDALEMAIRTNQDARKARLDIENSAYQIDEVRSRALPQVSGNGNITYNPILQKSALPGDMLGQPGKVLLVAFGQKWLSTAGITLSQNLFDQSILTGLKAAKGSREYYELSGELAEEQVIELVATAYYNVLVQRQKIRVIDSSITNTQKSEAIIKGLYANGLGKQIDVDRIAVSLANLESQKQQLQNAVTMMENQLKYFMGVDIRRRFQIPDMAIPEILPDMLESQARPDISQRTEYQVLRKQEELLNYQKQAYKAEYYPSLSLSGNYNYQGIGNTFPVFKGASGGVNWFDYSSIGATVRIPIFNGWATRSRIRQADVSIRRLQEDIEKTSLSLDMAFENAKAQMNSSIVILNSQRRNAALAKKTYQNTLNNYNQGLAYLTDLLQAENAEIDAQNNYSTALLDYKLAEIQLLKSQGKLKSLLN